MVEEEQGGVARREDVLAQAAAWLQASKSLINVLEYKPTSGARVAVWTGPRPLHVYGPQVGSASIIHFLVFSGYETPIMFTFQHVNKHINTNNVCMKRSWYQSYTMKRYQNAFVRYKLKKIKNQSLALKSPHINIKNRRETRCWRTQLPFFWELFWVDAGANLLNILQSKYWWLPRIHSAGDGAQQRENIKIMQMHLRKPHCFLSIWNIEI